MAIRYCAGSPPVPLIAAVMRSIACASASATLSRAAVGLGDLDPHQAELEDLGSEGGIELRGLLHRLHAGADFALGEVAHRALEDPFFFGEVREGVHTFLSDGPGASISRIPPSEPSTPVASYGM